MFFNWINGRQNTGYKKITFLSSKFLIPYDLHLLKFEKGSFIPNHIDSVDYGKHYRVNIILKNAKKGGNFICKNPIFETKRIKFFRPDISEHSVSEVIEGNRYVLSFGFILK